MDSNLSVGLVVHNESAHIVDCLRAIVLNHGRPFTFEILIVDNASTDDTCALAESFLQAAGVPFRIHRRPANHMAEARNDLVRMAGEWLAVTDADVRVPEGWLKSLSIVFSMDPLTAGLGGGNHPPEAHVFSSGWKVISEENLLHTDSVQVRSRTDGDLKPVDHLSTSNVIYRTAAVRAVGGFAAKFRRSGEDLDLSHRLRAAGYSLWFHPSISVEHHLPEGWWEWLKRCWRYGGDQWTVIFRAPFRVDTRRKIAAVAVVPVFLVFLIWPWLWLPMTGLQIAWMSRRAHFASGLSEAARAVFWACSSQQIYALGVVAGFLTLPLRR